MLTRERLMERRMKAHKTVSLITAKSQSANTSYIRVYFLIYVYIYKSPDGGLLA